MPSRSDGVDDGYWGVLASIGYPQLDGQDMQKNESDSKTLAKSAKKKKGKKKTNTVQRVMHKQTRTHS